MTGAVWGVLTAQHGEEIGSGYLTLAISGVHVWAKWLHNPCCLRVPIAQRKEEVGSGDGAFPVVCLNYIVLPFPWLIASTYQPTAT